MKCICSGPCETHIHSNHCNQKSPPLINTQQTTSQPKLDTVTPPTPFKPLQNSAAQSISTPVTSIPRPTTSIIPPDYDQDSSSTSPATSLYEESTDRPSTPVPVKLWSSIRRLFDAFVPPKNLREGPEFSPYFAEHIHAEQLSRTLSSQPSSAEIQGRSAPISNSFRRIERRQPHAQHDEELQQIGNNQIHQFSIAAPTPASSPQLAHRCSSASGAIPPTVLPPNLYPKNFGSNVNTSDYYSPDQPLPPLFGESPSTQSLNLHRKKEAILNNTPSYQNENRSNASSSANCVFTSPIPPAPPCSPNSTNAPQVFSNRPPNRSTPGVVKVIPTVRKPPTYVPPKPAESFQPQSSVLSSVIKRKGSTNAAPGHGKPPRAPYSRPPPQPLQRQQSSISLLNNGASQMSLYGQKYQPSETPSTMQGRNSGRIDLSDTSDEDDFIQSSPSPMANNGSTSGLRQSPGLKLSVSPKSQSTRPNDGKNMSSKPAFGSRDAKRLKKRNTPPSIKHSRDGRTSDEYKTTPKSTPFFQSLHERQQRSTRSREESNLGDSEIVTFEGRTDISLENNTVVVPPVFSMGDNKVTNSVIQKYSNEKSADEALSKTPPRKSFLASKKLRPIARAPSPAIKVEPINLSENENNNLKETTPKPQVEIPGALRPRALSGSKAPAHLQRKTKLPRAQSSKRLNPISSKISASNTERSSSQAQQTAASTTQKPALLMKTTESNLQKPCTIPQKSTSINQKPSQVTSKPTVSSIRPTHRKVSVARKQQAAVHTTPGLSQEQLTTSRLQSSLHQTATISTSKSSVVGHRPSESRVKPPSSLQRPAVSTLKQSSTQRTQTPSSRHFSSAHKPPISVQKTHVSISQNTVTKPIVPAPTTVRSLVHKPTSKVQTAKFPSSKQPLSPQGPFSSVQKPLKSKSHQRASERQKASASIDISQTGKSSIRNLKLPVDITPQPSSTATKSVHGSTLGNLSSVHYASQNITKSALSPEPQAASALSASCSTHKSKLQTPNKPSVSECNTQQNTFDLRLNTVSSTQTKMTSTKNGIQPTPTLPSSVPNTSSSTQTKESVQDKPVTMEIKPLPMIQPSTKLASPSPSISISTSTPTSSPSTNTVSMTYFERTSSNERVISENSAEQSFEKDNPKSKENGTPLVKTTPMVFNYKESHIERSPKPLTVPQLHLGNPTESLETDSLTISPSLVSHDTSVEDHKPLSPTVKQGTITDVAVPTICRASKLSTEKNSLENRTQEPLPDAKRRPSSLSNQTNLNTKPSMSQKTIPPKRVGQATVKRMTQSHPNVGSTTINKQSTAISKPPKGWSSPNQRLETPMCVDDDETIIKATNGAGVKSDISRPLGSSVASAKCDTNKMQAKEKEISSKLENFMINKQSKTFGNKSEENITLKESSSAQTIDKKVMQKSIPNDCKPSAGEERKSETKITGARSTDEAEKKSKKIQVRRLAGPIAPEVKISSDDIHPSVKAACSSVEKNKIRENLAIPPLKLTQVSETTLSQGKRSQDENVESKGILSRSDSHPTQENHDRLEIQALGAIDEGCPDDYMERRASDSIFSDARYARACAQYRVLSDSFEMELLEGDLSPSILPSQSDLSKLGKIERVKWTLRRSRYHQTVASGMSSAISSNNSLSPNSSSPFVSTNSMGIGPAVCPCSSMLWPNCPCLSNGVAFSPSTPLCPESSPTSPVTPDQSMQHPPTISSEWSSNVLRRGSMGKFERRIMHLQMLRQQLRERVHQSVGMKRASEAPSASRIDKLKNRSENNKQ